MNVGTTLRDRDGWSVLSKMGTVEMNFQRKLNSWNCKKATSFPMNWKTFQFQFRVLIYPVWPLHPWFAKAEACSLFSITLPAPRKCVRPHTPGKVEPLLHRDLVLRAMVFDLSWLMILTVNASCSRASVMTRLYYAKGKSCRRPFKTSYAFLARSWILHASMFSMFCRILHASILHASMLFFGKYHPSCPSRSWSSLPRTRGDQETAFQLP